MWTRLVIPLLCVCALPLIAAHALASADEDSFADVHVHFNWDQKEVIDARAIVAMLRSARVAFAVVAGTPSHLALELREAGGDLILPLFSPYTHELGRQDWYLDPRTVRLAEAGLRSGAYRGIGEVHFMRGFRPLGDNAIFLQLLALAERHRVPVLVHVDASSADPFLEICRRHAGTRLLLAHAGGVLHASQIRRILDTCANVMIEFSARDPWRYGGLTGDDGHLLPAWRDLVLAYPERFMTGTDPVWKVTRTQSWDQADDGWDHFPRLIGYHRAWLAGLPRHVAQKIRLDNARRFFAVDGPVQDGGD
jgi:hypothetical protein